MYMGSTSAKKYFGEPSLKQRIKFQKMNALTNFPNLCLAVRKDMAKNLAIKRAT